MLRMEIALFLVMAFVAAIYYSAGRRHTPLHRTFAVLLGTVLVHLLFDAATLYTVNHLDAVPRFWNDTLHRLFIGTMVLVVYLFYQYIAILVSEASGQPRRLDRAARAFLVLAELGALLGLEPGAPALVVGLGNREVTADALGPQVVDNLLITRHVVKNYGKAAYNCTRMNLVSSIEPGVMAKTGMETAEIISGVVKETGPDVLIVVDALAARSTRRLNRTIQITNTGIQPGSGVGNHRNALTQETLGVPVIAIGIPTVVDAATIVGDALEKLMSGEKEFDAVKYMGQHRMAFAELNNMYMTGKDIDSVVKRVSYTVSEGINIAMEKSFVV